LRIVTRKEERDRAFRAAALLSRVVVVHQQPDPPTLEGWFRCGWCERIVPMKEMRSHGGTAVWSDQPKERVDDLGPGVVGCWEMYPSEA